jgi:hypothetical protein
MFVAAVAASQLEPALSIAPEPAGAPAEIGWRLVSVA